MRGSQLVGCVRLAKHEGKVGRSKECRRVLGCVWVGSLEQIELWVTGESDALEDDQRTRNQGKVLGYGLRGNRPMGEQSEARPAGSS
jgi:hypothetical protein